MEITRVKFNMLTNIGEVTRNNRVFPKEEFDKMLKSKRYKLLKDTNQLLLTLTDYCGDNYCCTRDYVNMHDVIGRVKTVNYQCATVDIDKNIYESILSVNEKSDISIYPRVIAKPEYNPTTGVTTIRDARFVSFDLFVGRKP